MIDEVNPLTDTIVLGSSIQGPRGPMGTEGVAGTVGAQGPMGVPGTPGAAGANGAGFKATSTTSLAIASTGIVTFVVAESNLAYASGIRVRAISQSLPANYMEGIVTVFGGGELQVALDRSVGSGTHTGWNLGVAGDVGPTGADSTVVGPVGPAGPQGAKGDTGAQGPQGSPGVALVPSGTVMLFWQAAAPEDWTRVTTQHDKTLRVVGSTPGGSFGGVNSFTTVMAQTVVGNTTLPISGMPSHVHDACFDAIGAGGANAWAGQYYPTGNLNTGAMGGSQPHNHSIKMSIQYIDVLLASKN